MGIFDRCIDELQFARLFDFLICNNNVSVLDLFESVYRKPTLAALSGFGNVLFHVSEGIKGAWNREHLAYESIPTDGTHPQRPLPGRRLATRGRDHVD